MTREEDLMSDDTILYILEELLLVTEPFTPEYDKIKETILNIQNKKLYSWGDYED